MEHSEFLKYCEYASKIEGWFGAQNVFAGVNRIQRNKGINGNLFEIGVHHGKSALLMMLLAREGETFSCCDLFHNQRENSSYSGAGDYEIFLRNLKDFFGEILSNIQIYNCNSADLKPEKIGTNYRFFHIDGGDSLEETSRDLSLADKVVSDEGVVVIDDYFNYRFPEISVAVADSLLNKKVNFSPFIIAKNKIIFCRPEKQNFYYEATLNHDNKYFNNLENKEKRRSGKFYGYDTVTFFSNRK